MANDKAVTKTAAGAITKSADDLGIVPLGNPPAGMQRVVEGADIAGFWRQASGDELLGKLCGPAPAAMIAKSKAEHGMCVVELQSPCAVTQSEAGYTNLVDADKKKWKKSADGKQWIRRAEVGEFVAVSIRYKAKATLTKEDGTVVWLKVGTSRQIANGNDMFDYECYAVPQSKPNGQTAGQAERAGAAPAFES